MTPSALEAIHDRIDFTDTGNAERFARFAASRLVWVPDFNCWLAWDGTRWVEDTTGEAVRVALEVVNDLITAAASETGPERGRWLKHAIASASEPRIQAMIRLARSVQIMPHYSVQLDMPESERHKPMGTAVEADRFDRDPWLLACDNGTIDLRTRELRRSRPTDWIARKAPVKYDPDAECPLFIEAVNAWMPDAETVDFLQRVFGYVLTGLTIEQVMFILYGSGANGKSVLLQLLQDMLGDYALRTPAETLLARKDGASSYDVADLRGARLVVASESEDGRRLAEARVKELVGADTVRARKIYGRPFSFRPVAKLFLATNHRPQVRGTDHAIWRRLRLLPFPNRFTGDQCDPHLLEKLREELPGILAWAVRGTALWREHGLEPPASVTRATEAYRSEQDVLGEFLEDVCELDPNATADNAQLYAAFQRWSERAGEKHRSQRSLSMALKDRGYAQGRTGSRRYWHGLKIRGSDG